MRVRRLTCGPAVPTTVVIPIGSSSSGVWRAKEDDVRIHHLVVAARLVVLVQESSASVEIVFSQVKLICETCGVSPLEQTLATRLIERMNQYKD